MADLMQLEPRVRRYVKNCPLFTVQAALLDAAREFCVETLCHQVAIPLTLAAGTRTYSLVSGGHDLIQLVDAKVAGERNRLIKVDDVLSLDDIGTANRPQAYATDNPASITFSPIPSAVINVDVVAAVAPVGVTDADTKLLTLWPEVVASGAVSRLLIMPDEKWSNPQLGGVHENKFRAGINNARAQVLTSFSAAPQAMRPAFSF